MKKLLVPLILGLTCFCLSCKQESGMSDKAKKNLETSEAVAKMFESGDWSKVGDYIAADAVDHAGMKGDVVGLDSIKASFVQMAGMMSDMKNETVKELADDDYVFQWLKESWTVKTSEMGLPAGSKQTMNTIEVSKFNAAGKISDHWGFVSFKDMMKMMQPSMGNMMDSTKMKMDTSKHR
jgi:predicted ester cyclase